MQQKLGKRRLDEPLSSYPEFTSLFLFKLYIDTIRETLEEEDISRPFLSSSPSNGVDTEKEGWIAKIPSSPYWGDGQYF